MTKETKIGLLAGLAFIIVIGIVLSDHLTSSTEPPPAALDGAGNNVRGGVITPAAAQNPVAIIVPPTHVAPNQTVLTSSDLEGQATATSVIKIGPPSITQQTNPTAVRSITAPSQSVSVVTPAASGRAPADHAIDATDSPNTSLARLAQQNGEPLVSVTPTLGGSGATGAGSDYTVQPGDTLSRIAAKTMGSSNKANIDAIIRENPSLGANPNMIVVGKTFKIPAAAVSVAAPAQAPAPAPAPAQASAAAPQNSISPTEYWYTVKDGDNLTRIATEQLGSANYASIKELNKDILKGGDTIFPNMRLRLPGKPIASAN